MFKNQKDTKAALQRESRSDSNFSDLKQVLQQNLKINEVNFDAEGNINDNRNGLRGDAEDDEEYGGAGPGGAGETGKDINKTKSYIQRYFKAAERL
jgi:hypothetical protein